MDKPPKLEHGTIAEVTAILHSRGEVIEYQTVQKRIRRLSHYETLKLAMQVSRSIRERRQARAMKIKELLTQANAEQTKEAKS